MSIRRWVLGLVAALLLLLAGGGLAEASSNEIAFGDYVRSAKIDLQLNRDGSLQVTDTEVHHFPSSGKHGITRQIVVGQAASDAAHYRAYRLSDLSVSSPSGAPVLVQRTGEERSVNLRIGDPQRKVVGEQTYVIRYRLAHVMNEVPAASGQVAELYWNVISTANRQRIQSLEVTLQGPAKQLRSACVFGGVGQRTPCATKASEPLTFTVPGLSSGEGLTVSAQYPRSAFANLQPDLTLNTARLAALMMAGTGLLLPLLALAGMGLAVRSRGRDEVYAGLTPGLSPSPGQPVATVRGKVGPMAVQFTPPRGVQPGMVGTVIDETADSVDVSASVVDLAVRGFLTITETSDGYRRSDWTLTKIDPVPVDALSAYESVLLDGLFASGPTVQLSELRGGFGGVAELVKDRMYDEVVTRGWFGRRPDQQRASWMGPLVALALLGLGAISVSFVRPNWWISAPAFSIGSLGVPGMALFGAGMVLAGVIVSALGSSMVARTADGSAVLAQALGFKQYLVTAEARQFKFEEAQSIFSRYLPYAIVFGVAQRWAKTFEEVAVNASAQGVSLGPSLWYVGTGWGGGVGDGGGFGSIASGADLFTTTAAGTFAATPGSDGASAWSNSGGFGGSFGGSSGGGGGGFSGGSW